MRDWVCGRRGSRVVGLGRLDREFEYASVFKGFIAQRFAGDLMVGWLDPL